MKRVATAVVLIPLVLLTVFKAPVWLFAVIVGAVALLATREYLDIVAGYGLKPFRWITYVLVAATFASAARYSHESSFLPPTALVFFSPLLITGFFLLLALALRRDELKTAMLSAVASVVALLYVAFPLLLIVDQVMPSDALWEEPRRRFLVFAVLLFIWAGDTSAYYIGRSVGRHSLAPRISPKKTWEGTAGSMLGSIVAAILVWMVANRFGARHYAWPHWQLWRWVVWAAVINIAGQIGDLVESMMKRGAQIKDSGSILPGHGGILDRIDALLFAAPIMWYYPTLLLRLRDLFFPP